MIMIACEEEERTVTQAKDGYSQLLSRRCTENKMGWVSVEPWPVRRREKNNTVENTCKVGCTKNILKETGRLAINCTSCTRLRSLLGRCGSKNFLRSFIVWKFSFFTFWSDSPHRRSPALSVQHEVNHKSGILDGSIVVISMFVVVAVVKTMGNFPFRCAFWAKANVVIGRKHNRRSIWMFSTESY